MNALQRVLASLGPILGYLIATAAAWALLFGPVSGAPILRAILSFVAVGLGLLCGFAVAVVAATLYVFVAGPLQEWFLERFFDPPQPSLAVPKDFEPPPGFQGVLVSDLHIDTWSYPVDGEPSPREQRFLELLAAVKANPRVNSFYLNGDLMDAPRHPDANAPEPLMLSLSASFDQEQGLLLTRYDAILENLLKLTQPAGAGQPLLRRAIFQTGNHDIGVSGLRYVRSNMPDYLPSVQMSWNPSLLLQTDAQGKDYPGWVYLEHGHHWDPLLWLYMRYALMDILRFGHHRHEGQLLSGLQRGGKVGMGSQACVAASHLTPAPPRGTLTHHFAGDQPGFASTLVRLRYRQAARRTFRQFDRQGGSQVRSILIGHTHHPDRYVFPSAVFPEGRVYINSGDWSGVTDHCAYCVLDSDGSVRGPFQWELAKDAEFGWENTPHADVS